MSEAWGALAPGARRLARAALAKSLPILADRPKALEDLAGLS